MNYSCPLVSVCIGTYNREKYIRETLDSVFAQTYPNLEVIVVDDASTDHTLDVIKKKYGDRVQLIARGVNSGLPSVPRNQGIKVAQGEYIAFLDSDDVWKPYKIEKQVDLLERNTDLVLAHTYCGIIDGSNKSLGIRHEGRLKSRMLLNDLLEHCYITLSSCIVRTGVLQSVGCFNESPRYRAREDYELFWRLLIHGAAGCVMDILTDYRHDVTGISQHQSAWRSKPIDIPFYCLLKKRRDLWQEKMPSKTIDERLFRGCLQNSAYWRDLGYPGRALFFCYIGFLADSTQKRLYAELVKSVGSLVLRRKEMKKRRAGIES